MAERVQIVVEAKDSASGVMRAITSQFGAFGNIIEEITASNVNWGNVAQQSMTMVIQGLKETVRATVDYAREVRNLSAVSGASAEESSRFIQVLDDYGLTADDALTATRALTKNGLLPTIDTLAKLSDEYRNANTAQERNKLILDNLGRSGLQWATVLGQGGEALKAQGAAVADSLILNNQAIQQARDYEVALDNWDDSVQALKISIGSGLLPVLTDAMNSVDDNRRAAELARAAGVNLAQSGYDVRDSFMAQARAEREAQTALSRVSDAADKTKDNYSDLIKLTMEFSKTTQAEMPKVAYQNLLASLSVDGLTEAELNMATTAGVALGIFDQSAADSAMALDELNRKFAAGELSAKEYAAAVRSIPSSINTTLTLSVDNQTGSYVGDPSGGADLNPETPYARGGYVSGRGTGYSDSVRARLSNGEYVMNSDATRQNLSLLEALNNGAQTSGTNIFYGPVTLTVDEGAGGLLTLR